MDKRIKSSSINIKNLSKVFTTEEIETTAINDLSLQINKGDYVSISGPSGCGKSTLLSMIGLLQKPTIGEILIDSIPVSKMTDREKAAIRGDKIGFVFQSFNLISSLNVEENILLPLTYSRGGNNGSSIDYCNYLLEMVGLSHRRNHFPHQLSGGQQQRVAFARALIRKPGVILADEPTGNLDTASGNKIMDLLDTVHSEGATVVTVTHDPRFAMRSNRDIQLLDGNIQQ